ncbi:Zinc finger MYND domain-containing protein 10 [Globomyces sp. JEL0801]|nr:Zinc finger MYND domain-containing protein 10 [Globomyces sp. JEL0801]
MATINSSQTLNYTTQPTDEYISAFDSDHTVQNLKRFKLIDVGSIKWLKQHQSLEQLNIQAHKNIAKQQEEYVTESFLTFEKVLFIYLTKVSVLVLVLESSPWIRNLTTLQRFENMQWVNITPEDMLVVSHPEGQLKDYMGEETVDQLPPLVDLQRYLEELGLLEVPDTINPSISIQPVSTLHTQIAAQYTPTMVETHRELLVNMSTCDRKSMADSLAQMYDLTDMMDLLSDPKCGACGIMATQRCSLCKSECRACQVKNWKSHKSICELLRK